MNFENLKTGVNIYGTEGSYIAQLYGLREPFKYDRRQGPYVFLRLQGLTITLPVTTPVYKCKGGYTLKKVTDDNGIKNPAQTTII